MTTKYGLLLQLEVPENRHRDSSQRTKNQTRIMIGTIAIDENITVQYPDNGATCWRRLVQPAESIELSSPQGRILYAPWQSLSRTHLVCAKENHLENKQNATWLAAYHALRLP